MSKGTIKDPSIRLKPSERLFDFISTSLGDESELPENIWKIVEINGGKSGKKMPVKDISKSPFSKEETDILNTLRKDNNTNVSLSDLSIDFDDSDDDPNDDIENLDSKPLSKTQAIKQKRLKKEKQRSRLTINLDDIKWLDQKLVEKRDLNDDFNVYLHELLAGSRLVLPKNEILERNPELEKRCVRLRLEQEARMYNAMTKNVDSSRTKLPEDTISYQIKQINRQLIAVAQFLFSVAAGFAFGFIGVELMIGNLDFGFRLLLGIICALVIALAEIYFLAKKLNEEYDLSVGANTNIKVNITQDVITQDVITESGGKEHLE